MPHQADLPLIFDGLVLCKWDRVLFEQMKAGGLSVANFTCSIWEGLEQTVRNVADWKRRLADNADLLMQIHEVSDIEIARSQGRIGVILGWQNSTGYGEYLPNVRMFKDLGVRVVQLTYNTSNMAGSGCYESRDSGLTDFGRDLVHEMNDAGVAIDLSHVGAVTSDDVIRTSRKPVTYSHTCPAALFRHHRNKSDEQLKAIADRGGFVGVCTIPPFLAKGYDSTVDDYVDALMHVRNVVGHDQVGISTDITQGHPPEFFEWLGHDKGYGREVANLHGIPILKGFENVGQYGNLIAGLRRKGLSEGEVEKVAGLNWIVFLKEVWG